jgi:RimJ/RimL family protein N-acetyltransferase
MNNSQRILSEYWTEELGSPIDQPSGSVTVCAHGTLAGYNGIIAFRKNDACIVSTPPSLVEEFETIVHRQTCDTVWSSDFFEKALGHRIDRIVGPGWLGEIDPEHFTPCHNQNTHEIQPSEWLLFDTFMAECPPENRDVSSLESGRTPTVGVFMDGKIAAACGYELKNNKVAHIGILTHPEYRGRGLAKQAISAMTDFALTQPIGIQYWTLIGNTSSVSAAKSVGFHQFAETIAVRLK